MVGSIYLAGGGDSQASFYIDEVFISELDRDKSLVYIPVAMDARPYSACLDWFESVFMPRGITNIVMWTDLSRVPFDLKDAAGIYVGGGDTVRLLRKIRHAGAERYLFDALWAGVPLYGGSAGAILFGEDVRTAPEAVYLARSEANGMGLTDGYSVYCHYAPDEIVYHLVSRLDTPLFAIPEEAGVRLQGGEITVHGTAPVDVLTCNGCVSVYPGARYRVA